MNVKQALEIVKAALDLGIAKGNFQNLNEASALIEAFNVLFKANTNESNNDAN